MFRQQAELSEVEDEEELVIELADMGGDGADAGLEGFGGRLEQIGVYVDDLADAIDEQGEQAIASADNGHAGVGERASVRGGELQAFAQIEDGKNLAAEIDDAGKGGGGQRDANDLEVFEDFLDR